MKKNGSAKAVRSHSAAFLVLGKIFTGILLILGVGFVLFAALFILMCFM